MEVRLTPDQEAFVRHAIETGRLHRPEDALEEALSLWEERDALMRRFSRLSTRQRLRLREGRAPPTQESVEQLADKIERRGRERSAAESSLRR